MRQKLYVTLAVAVLALSGARETCKQFNGLKSLAGEWSGVWNTMLVYASSYAEGAAAETAPTLVASSASPCRGETPVVAARSRRKSPRVRPSARAKRDGATELRIDLEEVAFWFAAKPEATTAAADKVSKPRLQRATVNPVEMADALAGDFKSAFDAEALRSLLTGKGIEAPRAAALAELFERGRAVVARKAARAERGGERSRVRNRFVLTVPDPARASEEVQRAAEAVEAWPAGDASGDADLGEVEVFFVAPQSSGLLNCDVQPRR